MFSVSLTALADSHTAPERQPQKQLLSLLRTTTRLRCCQLAGDRKAHDIWKTMSAGHPATEAHGILHLSCSAIAACSGGEKPALRLTVNYSVPCAKKLSNHQCRQKVFLGIIQNIIMNTNRTMNINVILPFDIDISIDIQINNNINNTHDLKLSTITSEFQNGSDNPIQKNMSVHFHICSDTDTDTDIDIDIDIDIHIGTDTHTKISISISSYFSC